MTIHPTACGDGAATSTIIGSEAPGVKRCPWCGESFTPTNPRRRFCTHHHADLHHERARAERESIVRAMIAVEKPCIECAENFLPKGRGHICCSQDCARARFNLHRKASRRAEAAVRPPPAIIMRACRRPECRIEFEVHKVYHVYCSRDCNMRHWRSVNRYVEPRPPRKPPAPRLHTRCQGPECARELTGKRDRMYCTPRCGGRGWRAGKRRAPKAAAA